MKRKHWIVIIAGAMIAILLILWANSFSIALRSAGLLPNEITYSQYLAEDDGRLLRFVQSRNETGEVGLALLKRNAQGVWDLLDIDMAGGDPAMAQLAWSLGTVRQKYDYPNGEEISNFEFHYIFCGDNAIDVVKFLPEQIPNGISVKINQTGSLYWIHVTSCCDMDILNSFTGSVKENLLKNGCIA